MSVRGDATDSGRGDMPGCGELSCAVDGDGGMLLTEGLGQGDTPLPWPIEDAGDEAKFICGLGAGDTPFIELPGERRLIGWLADDTGL